MTLGFDGKKAVLNLTGIGNYSRRCINSLAGLRPADELLLFVPDRRNEAALSALTPRVRLVSSPLPLKKGLFYELWRNFLQWKTIRQHGVDLFHGLSNELPFFITRSGCKTVVTIHDLIFLHHPELYSAIQRRILLWKTRYACRVADRIVAVSDMTKRDLVAYYGCHPDQIDVVYQSYDAAFNAPCTAEQLQQVRQRYQLPERYLLCVGTIERRKNQEVLVRALSSLTDMHVVLVGRRTPYQDKLATLAAQLGVSSRVHILNKVSNADLPAIYQSAFLLGYMSLFEGFGIPIVEALASGVPVVAATGSCLEEAGGPDAVYLAPDDEAGFVSTVSQLLADEPRRQQMIAAGRAYVERFSDEALGRNLLHVYQKLMAP